MKAAAGMSEARTSKQEDIESPAKEPNIVYTGIRLKPKPLAP